MSKDYNWVVEILISYINGPEFQGETSAFLKNQTILYFDPTATAQSKKNTFIEYKTHFEKTVTEFFTGNGLKKEHYEHTLNLILSSEEGLNDTRLSSNLLASREFSVFDLLMTYYYALSLHEDAVAAKEADPIFLDELLGNAELAEINLAIAVSECIKTTVLGKKGKAPSQPAPSKPAAVPASSSSTSTPQSAPSFKLTGTGAGATPSASTGGKLTQLSVDAVNAKKDKLQAIEGEITQKLAKLREEQEKKIRSLAPELAESIIQKRKKALAIQAGHESTPAGGKKNTTQQQLGKNVGAVPAKKK